MRHGIEHDIDDLFPSDRIWNSCTSATLGKIQLTNLDLSVKPARSP
jgi:hypothetical protein